MGRYTAITLSKYSDLLALGLTAQDLGNIQPGVLLREELPGANDAIGRIDQGAIHIEEAVNTRRFFLAHCGEHFGEELTWHRNAA